MKAIPVPFDAPTPSSHHKLGLPRAFVVRPVWKHLPAKKRGGVSGASRGFLPRLTRKLSK
jgi:hypothetical protein